MNGAIGSQLHGDFLLVAFFGVTGLIAAVLGYIALTRATYRLFFKEVFGQPPGYFDETAALKLSLGAAVYLAIAIAVVFS